MALPRFRSIVLDTTDVPRLAAFYRDLLGWQHAEDSDPTEVDWQVVVRPEDGLRLAFQRVDELPVSTWPGTEVPQQLHLDFSCAGVAELEENHRRALDLGARVLRDESDDPEVPLRVYADPAGHPFCLFSLSR